ncbi:MAG: hypothetical protein GY855_04360 [candidate division Zixibacteria bacterium]|nr:hypothetical protein [candidate division Zixibacteria bacterium]
MRIIIITIAILLILSNGLALGQSFEDLVLEGKELIDEGVNLWKYNKMLTARALFERMLETQDDNNKWLIYYYLTYCDYRLADYFMSQDDKKQAKDFIDDGLEMLDKCIELKPKSADAFALRSSLLGRKAGLNPLKAIWYGPKSNNAIKNALQLDNQNPRVYLIKGINQYFTPEMWGGGKEKALSTLKKSVELFSKDTAEFPMPDWGYDESYMWLGIIEMDLNHLDSAEVCLQRALEKNPNCGRIKNVLLFKLEEKRKVGN